MIAIVAGGESWRNGPVPIALAHAGFDACEACDPATAARHIGELGPEACTLVLHVDALMRNVEQGWERLLEEHPALPVVVVAHGGPAPAAHALGRAPHRIVLDHPFDAAAVVAAALRASATAGRLAPRPAQRASKSESLGSRYAS